MHPLQRFNMPAKAGTARRAKRATAPLDAAARARFAVLPSSDVDTSGSEHEAAALSSLVHDYLFEADATVPSGGALTVDQESDGVDDEGDKTSTSSSAATADDVTKEIKGILEKACKSDDLSRRLTADVMESVRGLKETSPTRNRSAFRRAVMSSLRDRGHDAGLCKVRWAKSSKMAAGNYEFIDVIVSAQRRFIVDVEFAAEFEVARPTPEFQAVHAALPEVLVAPAEDMRRVVKAVSAAARRSLKSQGFSVPPWRKRRFTMAKWFGQYRRTLNPVAEPEGATASCRKTIVGFAPQPPIGTTS